MIKLTSLISPKIIGVASACPTVRSLKEAEGDIHQQSQGGAQRRHKLPPRKQQPQQQAPQAPAQDPVAQTADAVSAETDAGKNNDVSLDSLSGQTFMLAKLINTAQEENQIDALAASFVDQLHIKDFEAFKQATSKFSAIEGYSKLMDSIASKVDHSEEAFNSPSGDDAGHGDDNGEGPKEEPINEIKDDEETDHQEDEEKDDTSKPIWTQFKKKDKKSKK